MGNDGRKSAESVEELIGQVLDAKDEIIAAKDEAIEILRGEISYLKRRLDSKATPDA